MVGTLRTFDPGVREAPTDRLDDEVRVVGGDLAGTDAVDGHGRAGLRADADDHLRASSLEWTILGPGALTDDDPSGEITLGRAGSDDERKTARGNVALVAARALADPRGTAGKFIEFSDGDTPIAQALENLS